MNKTAVKEISRHSNEQGKEKERKREKEKERGREMGKSQYEMRMKI
jgi:hypothetical protein